MNITLDIPSATWEALTEMVTSNLSATDLIKKSIVAYEKEGDVKVRPLTTYLRKILPRVTELEDRYCFDD
jgi:uncharacterized protein Yka (UPF0111/DUF47 family)